MKGYFDIKAVAVIALTIGALLGTAMGTASRSIYPAAVGVVTGVGLVTASALISESADREGKRLILIRKEIRDSQFAKPSQSRSESEVKGIREATKTIIRQIIAGSISLSAGGAIIWLIATWANSWEIYWPDNSEHIFAGAIWGSIGLIGLTVFVTYKQFQDTLLPVETLKRSIKYTFLVGLLFLTLDLLLHVLAGANLKILALELVYLFMAFSSIGLATGLTQFVLLSSTGFDDAYYAWLISNDAAVRACQSGVLPYRVCVAEFWRAVSVAGGISIALLIGIILNCLKEEDAKGLLLASCALMPLMVVVGHYRTFMKEPRIAFVEGPVEKSSRSEGKDVMLFLTCNEQIFRTNDRIWNAVFDGKPYRLWYSDVTGRITAYQPLWY